MQDQRQDATATQMDPVKLLRGLASCFAVTVALALAVRTLTPVGTGLEGSGFFGDAALAILVFVAVAAACAAPLWRKLKTTEADKNAPADPLTQKSEEKDA